MPASSDAILIRNVNGLRENDRGALRYAYIHKKTGWKIGMFATKEDNELFSIIIFNSVGDRQKRAYESQ